MDFLILSKSKIKLLINQNFNKFQRCSFILLHADENSETQIINFSEAPICSHVRALWQLQEYSQVIEITKDKIENDPILFYFNIQSNLKVTIFTKYIDVNFVAQSKEEE